MNKAHNNINWENYPSSNTPINEQNLNKMDNSIDEIDNRVITLDTTKVNKTEIAQLIKDISFDENNGIFTITRKNGSSFTIDTKLEKLAINFGYDPEVQQIVLTLADGTIEYIDLSDFVTQYEFIDTDTISFSTDTYGNVSASIKEGSIEEKHLRPDYLAEIKVETGKAQASAINAAKSEINAKESEINAESSKVAANTSETNATNAASTASEKAIEANVSAINALDSANIATSKANEAVASAISATDSSTSASDSANIATQKATAANTSAVNAENYSKHAQSYAVGTGNMRPNEAIDNSKYYYEQSKNIYENFESAGNVTGVKGNAETSYRTGNVNLTSENIGAVNKAGDTMTGDLIVPVNRANANMSVPCAGRIDSTTLIPQGLSECKTFLGSIVDENSTFWNIISTRHGNGYNDGRYFGMYIRSLLLGEGSHGGSLLWNKQMGSNEGWLGERVLLDSVNYKDFCLPLSGDIGNMGVPYGLPAIASTGTPIAGGSIVSDNLIDLSNYRSFIGTHLNGENNWNHVISTRHHNGWGDGTRYGMYLRAPIATGEDNNNLYWRVQNTSWFDERILLDSYNYEKYCLPLSNESLIAENSVCRISLLSKVGNTERCGVEAYTKGNGRTGGLYFYNGNATLKSYNMFSIDVTEDVDVARAYYFDTDGLYPIIDHVDLGKSSFHWRNIYANNGTIQTSDRTKKTNISSLEIQKAQSFINGLNPVSYKMIDGTSGRTHYGFIAQDIEELMNTLNMDSLDFAGFIKSPKKTIRYEDENGTKLENPIEEVIENEYDYALRYDEFIAPLIKVVQEQQKEIEQLKEDIEFLKEYIYSH